MPKDIFKYIFVGILIIILGFSFGYIKTFLSTTDNNKTVEPDEYHTDVSYVEEIRLVKNGRLRFKTYYIKCGHMKENIIPSQDYLGFTKSQLKKEFSDWEIEQFTPDEAVLIRQSDGICDEHYYIGILEGYVVLFQGRPDLPSKAIEKTDILVDVLRLEDRKILEKGLIIDSEEEFLKIKEGLTS